MMFDDLWWIVDGFLMDFEAILNVIYAYFTSPEYFLTDAPGPAPVKTENFHKMMI